MSPRRVRDGLRVLIVLIGAIACFSPAGAKAHEKKAAAFEVLPADLMEPADRPARASAEKAPARKPGGRKHGADAAAMSEIVNEFGGFGGNLHDDEKTSDSSAFQDLLASMMPALLTGESTMGGDFTWEIIPVMNEDIDTINRARTKTVDGLRAVNHETGGAIQAISAATNTAIVVPVALDTATSATLSQPPPPASQ